MCISKVIKSAIHICVAVINVTSCSNNVCVYNLILSNLLKFINF